LTAQGTCVHVVTHKPADINGVTVERFRVPDPGWTNPRRWQGRKTRYLLRFLHDFDVVNIQFLSDWGFTENLIEQGCLVATPWGSDIIAPPGEGTPTSQLHAARVMMLRQSAAITTLGTRFAKVVADYAGIARSRVDVLPFGVDTLLFDRDRVGCLERSHDAGGAGHTVGFFKGFRPVYDPQTLIRAIPLVRRCVPDTRFELVGDGPQLEACQALAQELGVHEAVAWFPRCAHQKLPNLIARWAVSVIPSVHESFGVAALESLAMRVPVVASDVCGLRDTVADEETGRLVPPGNPKALADAVVAFLVDPDRRRGFGAAGRAFVEHRFNAADVHKRWVAFFKRVRQQQCVML